MTEKLNKVTWLATSLALASALTGCQPQADTAAPESAESDLASTNGLSMLNGLSMTNGLSGNGLSGNGLSGNGLSGNGSHHGFNNGPEAYPYSTRGSRLICLRPDSIAWRAPPASIIEPEGCNGLRRFPLIGNCLFGARMYSALGG